jgi:hypothetical protein
MMSNREVKNFFEEVGQRELLVASRSWDDKEPVELGHDIEDFYQMFKARIKLEEEGRYD